MAQGSPGADSSTPVTSSMIASATSVLGAPPVFWGRYFTSVSTTGDVEYRHSVENAPLNSANIRLLPIARQTENVSGTASQGASDGAANARDFVATFGVDELVSQGGQFYMFLDVESNPALSADYWMGWTQGLANEASTISEGAVQVLPCLYAAQGNDATFNALQQAMASGAPCLGVWIARYFTGSCLMGDWSDDIVTPAEPNPFPVPILAWQYAENCASGTIDCSQTNPEIDLENDLLSFLVLPPG